MRAVEVLPVPRGPAEQVGVGDLAIPNGVAQGALVTCSWPSTSANRWGRKRRYSAW